MSITTKMLIKGATTLVAALAWNEAAKSIVDYIVPISRDHDDKAIRMAANIIYAIIVTIIIILLIFTFNKLNLMSDSNGFVENMSIASNTNRNIDKIPFYKNIMII